METLEELQNIVIVNDEPEFIVQDSTEVSANYFVICEEDNLLSSGSLYETKIAGLALPNWVARACPEQPKMLKVQSGADILDIIRPYIDLNVDYTVVLYASTPLVTRSHLSDLLGFVSRKHMNCCKLVKGYVFKNEFISAIDEIYSIDTYNFSTNDFFEIKNSDDLAYVTENLTKKVFAFHRRNGVVFDDEKTTIVDASVEIGYGAKIGANVSLLGGTSIGESTSISNNSIISGSKIGESVVVGFGSFVLDSIVKDNCTLGERIAIKSSVVGNNVKVGFLSQVLASSVRDGVVIAENVTIDNSKIFEGCFVGKHSKILGDKIKTVVEKNSTISFNVTLVDKKIAENSFVEANKCVFGKVGEV